MSSPLLLLRFHPLSDDSGWHFDTQFLSHTWHPGPDFWHLPNVMCPPTWGGPSALDPRGPLGHFLSARSLGSLHTERKYLRPHLKMQLLLAMATVTVSGQRAWS